MLFSRPNSCDTDAVARLLSLFLALLLALPATQALACQNGSMPGLAHVTDGHALHHGEPHPADGPRDDRPATVLHDDCLGCIAPIDVQIYRPIAAPELIPIVGARPGNKAGSYARAPAPELPPPRPLV